MQTFNENRRNIARHITKLSNCVRFFFHFFQLYELNKAPHKPEESFLPTQL